MSELISVVMPTYKRPDRLIRAITSVLNQSFQNFEVLVVNDDEQDDYLKKLIQKLNDNRIRLLNNQRRKGANGARNTGILNANGAYIAFMDDDDEWLEENLSTQLERLRSANEKVGLVYGGYLYEEGSNWKEVFHHKEGNIFADIFTGRFTIGASSNIFIKSSVIEEVGLWDEDLLRQQDLEFLIRVFEKFEVVFNNHIIAKIYGHNEPDPKKAFTEREKLIEKVSEKVINLSIQDQKLFLSNHFRRQAIYLVRMRKYKEAKQYWKKGFSNRSVPDRKDIRILMALFKNIYK